MTKLNRAQRLALKRIFDRTPIYFPQLGSCAPPRQMTYREWRRNVQPAFGGDCVMVFWSGMWLGIEKDGYVHS